MWEGREKGVSIAESTEGIHFVFLSWHRIWLAIQRTYSPDSSLHFVVQCSYGMYSASGNDQRATASGRASI